MPLSDTAIRNAKHGPKPIKLGDERGLFLLLQPSGGKLWRLKYRFDGHERKLSLGIYPDVSLKEARRRRDEARTLLANGVDPGMERKRARAESDERRKHTFAAVAEEYLLKMAKDQREAVTIKKSRWLVSLLTPELGSRPVAEITPGELLKVIKVVEEKDQFETARRMRSISSRIFRFAVATSRAHSDPSALLRGALAAPRAKHHSAILDPAEVGNLLLAIDGYQCHPLTLLALQLTPHVFVRPGELRRAEWAEFDLGQVVWTIPADKMKMREPHRVPLSRQVVEILGKAKCLSSRQKYVFSSLYPGNRPMSENTINAALRRLGYTKDQMTAHGFRAMASTLLNESGLWSPDAVEAALAHKTRGVRGMYHRGQHWDERKRMAQWWSDHLDQLRSNARQKNAVTN